MADDSIVYMLGDAPVVHKSAKIVDVPGSGAESGVAMSVAQMEHGTATHFSGSTLFRVVTPASEDEEDVRAARAARAEDPAPIPYSEFRKELGL